MEIPQLITIPYREKAPDMYKVINVTSKGWDKYKYLSPFLITDIRCYGGLRSVNLQNAWSFSHVYPEHDNKGEPNDAWYKWRDKGFSSKYPQQRPIKDQPLYVWWDGVRYKQFEARKHVYTPLYELNTKNDEPYRQLKKEYDGGKYLALREFDAYLFESLREAYSAERFSHAFMIYKMLTNQSI